MSKPSAIVLTPASEIRARIKRLKPLIEKGRLDAAFFHYKIDYYYFSGTMQDGFLFVPLTGAPVLFIKRGAQKGHAGIAA